MLITCCPRTTSPQARGTLVSQRGHVHTPPGWVYRGPSHWTLTHPPPNKHSRPLPILTDQMFKHGRQFNQWTLLSLGWGSEGIVTLLYSQQQGRGGSSGRGERGQMVLRCPNWFQFSVPVWGPTRTLLHLSLLLDKTF